MEFKLWGSSIFHKIQIIFLNIKHIYIYIYIYIYFHKHITEACCYSSVAFEMFVIMSTLLGYLSEKLCKQLGFNKILTKNCLERGRIPLQNFEYFSSHINDLILVYF